MLNHTESWKYLLSTAPKDRIITFQGNSAENILFAITKLLNLLQRPNLKYSTTLQALVSQRVVFWFWSIVMCADKYLVHDKNNNNDLKNCFSNYFFFFFDPQVQLFSYRGQNIKNLKSFHETLIIRCTFEFVIGLWLQQ